MDIVLILLLFLAELLHRKPKLRGKTKPTKGNVYLLSDKQGNYKIGVAKDINRRIKQLQTGQEDELVLVHSWNKPHPYQFEKRLHDMFEHCRIRRNGEWFKLNQNEVKMLREMR